MPLAYFDFEKPTLGNGTPYLLRLQNEIKRWSQ